MAFKFGPGAMVAAAFIGPGTVTTATAAGAATGAGLLWAVGFSVVATLILQELALRSALVTNQDLAALMRRLGEGYWWRWPLIVLVILTVGVGNAAYQSGNLSGAGIGLSAALGLPLSVVVAGASAIAATLILLDRYQWLEQLLVALVGVMALLFCGLAVVLMPLFLQQAPERLLPSFSEQHVTLMLALIGTTVVPYNLFLHATAVRRRWQGVPLSHALREARQESLFSILIGGGITTAILMVAAVLLPDSGQKPVLEQLMASLDAQFPGWGRWLVGGGLFAAGLTSAIAAPVAAGWAVCGALGWSTLPGSLGFKSVAMLVLVVGCVFALLADRPAALIISAQATNAVLLPIVAMVLVILTRNEALLGRYRNHPLTNLAAIMMVVLVSVLALHKLLSLL